MARPGHLREASMPRGIGVARHAEIDSALKLRHSLLAARQIERYRDREISFREHDDGNSQEGDQENHQQEASEEGPSEETSQESGPQEGPSKEACQKGRSEEAYRQAQAECGFHEGY